MTAYPHAPREVPLDAAATLTWAVQCADGMYVVDPASTDGKFACSYDRSLAHLWLDEERAKAWAAKTPWAGASAKAVRGRP